MNIDADFNKEYYDKGYLPATMGCRTYLMKNVNGEPGDVYKRQGTEYLFMIYMKCVICLIIISIH